MLVRDILFQYLQRDLAYLLLELCWPDTDKYHSLALYGNYEKLLEADDVKNIGGLNSSSYGGHIEIVKLLIEKGANDWNEGLRNACCGGYIEIVKLLIEKAGTALFQNGANDWNKGLEYACAEGHIEIVELLIEKGADNLEEVFVLSCSVGHIEIVKLLAEKVIDDLGTGLSMACKKGHIEVVKLLAEKGIGDLEDLNFALRCVSKDNNEIVKLLTELKANYEAKA